MEADLYNLMPESAETNRLRSNYQMGTISGEDREFGSCDVEIKDRTFEPRPEIQGDIARMYFYMDQAYPGRGIVSRQLRPLLKVWNKEDPVDDWNRGVHGGLSGGRQYQSVCEIRETYVGIPPRDE